MWKKKLPALLVFIFLCICFSGALSTAIARTQALQTPAGAEPGSTYQLGFSRSYGFSAGSMIRGRFTLRIIGRTEQIENVTFTIDGQPMRVVDQAPFRFRFTTDDYSPAVHDLSATVTTKDGTAVPLSVFRYQFLTAEEERDLSNRILLPLIGGILSIVMIGSLYRFSRVMRDEDRGIPAGLRRTYGRGGGAICSNCSRPTPLGWHLPSGWGRRLDRCQNCGAIQLMTPIPEADLRKAEQAELLEDPNAAFHFDAPDISASRLTELLENSRFVDGSREGAHAKENAD